MNDVSKAAQALGRRGKGKKKTLSPEEIRRRTERILANGHKRWPKKAKAKAAARRGRPGRNS